MLLVTLSGLSLAAPARAQEEPASSLDQQSEDDADALVARGIALRRTGQDGEALKSFQRAEVLEPGSARVQVHLAATHQALGEWEAADRYLTRALAQSADPYIEKHQSTLAAARRRIDTHIGSLQVSGGPPSTEIRLNGRLIGTLPIAETVRVEGGIYTLEARLAGHYPVTRSIALAGGSLVRESIRLQSLSVAGLPARREEQAEGPANPAGSKWLTWSFAGLSVAAGAGTAAAWLTREQYVDTWNDDDRCLRQGQTREQVCGDERDDGERAETWMWIGVAATGGFAAATLVSWWAQSDEEPNPTVGFDCGVGLGQVRCAGRF